MAAVRVVNETELPVEGQYAQTRMPDFFDMPTQCVPLETAYR